MAQDSGGSALYSLCSECAFRGSFFRPEAHRAAAPVYTALANEILHRKQVATENHVIMPVKFHIPGALREFTDGRSSIEIAQTPTTLREALAALWELCPGLRDRITTEQGEIRQHINIFIGDLDCPGHQRRLREFLGAIRMFLRHGPLFTDRQLWVGSSLEPSWNQK